MPRGLEIGAARTQITPPLLVSLDGEFRDRRADRVISDLYARALVVDDGIEPVALLTLDVCRLDSDVRDRIVDRVARVSRIARDRVLLACTHTHGGPTLIETPWYSPDASYADVCVRRAGDAVALADATRRPGSLTAFACEEEALAFNRRYRMRDGSVRTNPGPLNPDIVAPVGPIDPEVGVWHATDVHGETIAVVVNYALHVAVVTQGVSGDYPHVIEREIRQACGPEVVALFMPGCCGDVNHTDVAKPGPRLGPSVAGAIGMRIAGKVLEGMGRSPAPRFGVEGPVALRLTTRHLELPLRDPPASELGGRDAMPAGIEGASEDISSRTTSEKGLIEVRKYRDWRLGRFRGTTDRVTVQLLACGDMALVTLPGEMFVELGLTMRRSSPFGSTLLSTLNGSASYYLPTAEAYAEGGYEVESTPIAAGGAEEIVRCVVASLQAFEQDAASHDSARSGQAHV